MKCFVHSRRSPRRQAKVREGSSESTPYKLLYNCIVPVTYQEENFGKASMLRLQLTWAIFSLFVVMLNNHFGTWIRCLEANRVY